jgi:hypothetical protein
LRQLIDRFFVILPVGLIHLLTDFIYFAIGLGLGFIASDNCRNLLRVTLGHLRGTPTLSLRARRYGGNQQMATNIFSLLERAINRPGCSADHGSLSD